MKNRIYLQMTIMVIAIILPSMLYAQLPPIFSDNVVDAPIDGGLSLLVAGGIGYGVKKIREKQERK